MMMNLVSILNMGHHLQGRLMKPIWPMKSYWRKRVMKAIIWDMEFQMFCIMLIAPLPFLITQARLSTSIWMVINIMLEEIKEFMVTISISNNFINKGKIHIKVSGLFLLLINHSIKINSSICMEINIASVLVKTMFIHKARIPLIFQTIIYRQITIIWATPINKIWIHKLKLWVVTTIKVMALIMGKALLGSLRNNKSSSGMIFQDGKEWESIIKLIKKNRHQHSKINLNHGLMTGSEPFQKECEKAISFLYYRNDI